MKDKNLDKLFNQKLNSSTPSFNEGAWEKAEQLINNADDVAMDKLFADRLSNQTVPFNKAAWSNAKRLIKAAGLSNQNTIYKTLSFYASAAAVAGLLYFGLQANQEINTIKPLVIKPIETINTEPEGSINNIESNDIATSSPSEAAAPNNSITSTLIEEPEVNTTSSGITNNVTPDGSASTDQLNMVRSSNDIGLNTNEASAAIEKNSLIDGSGDILNAESDIKPSTTLTDNSIISQTTTFSENEVTPSIIYMPVSNIQPISINLPGLVYNQPRLPKSSFNYTKHYIGLIGGPTATKYANGGRYKNGFFIGARYGYNLNSKWTINSNLVYQKTDAQNISKEFRDVDYGFGSNKTTTTVTANSLHYIELPLYASYNLYGRHSLDFGGYIGYMFNSSSEIVEVNESSFTDTRVSTKTGWGMNDGMNALDAGIILGYNYRLNSNLRLGGRLNYGFTDITKNDFYQNNSFDNHFQLRFVLDYKLFNK